jgi:hypothetical protein
MSVHTRPPLDDNLYRLDDDERAFLKTQTGIDNDEDLKAHILAVQAKAYDVCDYYNIASFDFHRDRS